MLTDYLRRIMSCQAFDDFFLVGGTALSLQIGHRISVDIDLFTSIPYGSLDLCEIKTALTSRFAHIERTDSLERHDMIYTLFIGDTPDTEIKLDLCYEERCIFPLLSVDGIRMASDKEIAAMKMNAIVNGSRRKDYWDIHELLNRYSLADMISWAVERYPYSLTPEEITEAIRRVDSLEDKTEIISTRGVYWEFVVDDLLYELEKV